ncbi:hypothetical protein CB1_000149011 [Camelus ferus]|nr:hypothetical protein CB1_000149011 [Camelus ferus]
MAWKSGPPCLGEKCGTRRGAPLSGRSAAGVDTEQRPVTHGGDCAHGLPRPCCLLPFRHLPEAPWEPVYLAPRHFCAECCSAAPWEPVFEGEAAAPAVRTAVPAATLDSHSRQPPVQFRRSQPSCSFRQSPAAAPEVLRYVFVLVKDTLTGY